MELRFSADAGGPKLDEAFKKLLLVGEGRLLMKVVKVVREVVR